MKNLLKIGLLALLLPLYSVGQITIQLPKGIVTEERLKSYGDSLVKVLSGNTKPIEPVDPVDPVTPGKPDCPKGPFIDRIFSITSNDLQFQFDADDVYGIEFWVKDEKGNEISHGLLADLKGNIQTVKYRALQLGTYQLSIAGSTCNSKVFTKVFYVSGVGVINPPVIRPPVNPTELDIWMNTTGNGLDVTAKHGIMPQWVERIEQFTNLNWKGEKFSGITGVRLGVPWLEYEPKRGQYQDAAILRAMEYCMSKGLKLSICFIPERQFGDGMFEEKDMAHVARPYHHEWLNKQTTVYTPYLNVYSISAHSTTARAKIKETVKHLVGVLKNHPDNTFDIAYLALGNTEEFYNPILKNSDHSKTVAGAGYGPADAVAWKVYAAERGFEGAPMQIPDNFSDAWAAGNFWNSTPVGQAWYDFITQGMTDLFVEFRNGVHESGGKAGGYIADVGAAQSAWYMTFNLHKLFPGCDAFYATDGGNPYQVDDKLLVIDFVKGTYPDAEPAAEFDPDDMRLSEHNSLIGYGEPLNWPLWERYAASILSRGGDLHFAMAYSPGDNGKNNNIAPGTEQMYNIRKRFIDSYQPIPIEVLEPIRQKIESYSGDQPYRYEWKRRGGGLNVQIPIVTY